MTIMLNKEKISSLAVKNSPALPRWQFVSQGHSVAAHLFHIQMALDGGCRWVQLRLKNQHREQMLEAGRLVRKLCDRYKAIFILNDHLHLTADVGADGVHLGIHDTSIKAARNILGENYIIGGTANTAAEVISRVEQGVDYIGLGPYRFTRTKQGLSPVLGLAGYREILRAVRDGKINMACEDAGPSIYAIGGILEQDIQPILKTGITGIAISGWLSHQINLQEMENNSGLKLSCMTAETFYGRWKEEHPSEAKRILDKIRAFDNAVHDNRSSEEARRLKKSI